MFVYQLDSKTFPCNKNDLMAFRGSLNRWEMDESCMVTNNYEYVFCFYDNLESQKLRILENILNHKGVIFERYQISVKDLFSMAKRLNQIQSKSP